ncbi:hypothetical protein [Mycobacterium sp.]|uniref:hypothetical protein n=1 Tax=Mycobacterium sp. TaxID=1785 RepID=UPI003BB1F178
MSVRYDEPHAAAKAANTLIRWLAEIGISIAGLRPDSSDEQVRTAAPSIPVFALADLG